MVLGYKPILDVKLSNSSLASWRSLCSRSFLPLKVVTSSLLAFTCSSLSSTILERLEISLLQTFSSPIFFLQFVLTDSRSTKENVKCCQSDLCRNSYQTFLGILLS